jgi:hypothetical protein
MATKEEIKEIIIELSAGYPDWKPPDINATLRVYQNALEDYPADLLRRAAKRCLDGCLFFPKIAEIKRAIGEITANADTMSGRENFQKAITSPKVQAYLDEFRQRMVNSGKWTEGHRINRFNSRNRI